MDASSRGAILEIRSGMLEVLTLVESGSRTVYGGQFDGGGSLS